MRRWRRSAWAGCGVALFLLCRPTALPAATCDEYNSASPARTTQVTLSSSDAVDESRDELRSFIETGSLGRVTVSVLSANPSGIVGAVSATPEVSDFSSRYGERLKGIAVTVRLKTGRQPAEVVLRLRQVCARYFRNTFLYY